MATYCVARHGGKGFPSRRDSPGSPERFRRTDRPPRGMSQGSGGGLMSSAGLVRYFDSESQNALTFDPKTVLAFGLLFGVGVQVLSLVFAV